MSYEQFGADRASRDPIEISCNELSPAAIEFLETLARRNGTTITREAVRILETHLENANQQA